MKSHNKKWESYQKALEERHNPRENYRNYTPKRYPFFLLVFLDLFLSLFTAIFLLLQFSVPALVIFSFCMWSDLLTKTAIFFTAVTLLLLKLLRSPIKRVKFILKLKRICKKNHYSLQFKNLSPKTLFSSSNKADITVQTLGLRYDIMFIPSPKHLTVFVFQSNEEIKIVTEFIRNRINDALGLKKKEKIKKYGFQGIERSQKILLFNPAPFEIYRFATEQRKLIPSGSGDEIFEYTIHTGRSFIRKIAEGAE